MLKKLAERYKKVQKSLADTKAKADSAINEESDTITELQHKLETMESKWSARDKELVDKDDECIRLKRELADVLSQQETKQGMKNHFKRNTIIWKGVTMNLTVNLKHIR